MVRDHAQRPSLVGQLEDVNVSLLMNELRLNGKRFKMDTPAARRRAGRFKTRMGNPD